MHTSSLESINKVYQCASNYIVSSHRVSFSELGYFSVKVNQFRSLIGESIYDAYWQKYLRVLCRLRFELCAAPMLNKERDDLIAETLTTIEDHLKHCHAIYPLFVEPAKDVLHLLEKIRGDTRNPLVDKLIEITPPNSNTAWVIKESRLIEQVENVIDLYPRFKPNLQTVHYSQLISAICYDALIIIGSPAWYPLSVFTSPRAPRLNIVHFNWMSDTWKLPNTFIANYVPSQTKRTVLWESDTHQEANTPADSILLHVDAHQVYTIVDRGDRREYDEVDAQCVVLEGETAVFVVADPSSTILIIDLEECEDERVRSIQVNELLPGTFMLIRTSGGGDYIVPIADQIMGTNAQSVRSAQNEWKTLLRDYVKKHGLLKTSIDLLDLGSEIANEVNVRNWIYPRNIKTRSEKDFLAIMRLIGLEERANEIWQNMEIISSAHRRAGFQLRKKLLGLVDRIPADRFRKDGKIEFRLAEDDEDAKLTAYRVESILPNTYKVAYSQIGVPFKLGK
ncbi:hypothetical protein ANRL4_03773 [Anaerolineae bacterium]|nr:hypothetical protein ANRL4_03773 [Anaerolineae bacterium]